MIPTNDNIYTKSIVVYGQVGKNSLQFSGTGTSDGLGLTIDNVQLVRDGTALNLVENGGF